MALAASNVRVGVSGEVSVGATTATAPTSASSELVGFTGLGYVNEDGITETTERDTEDIVAWQNATVVRTLTTSAKTSYVFTLIETTKDTIETAYGATVTQSESEGTYTISPGSTGGVKSFVIDVVDGANLKRIYLAEAEVSERGDVVYASGEPIGYELTVTTYSDPVVFETALGNGSSSSSSEE